MDTAVIIDLPKQESSYQEISLSYQEFVRRNTFHFKSFSLEIQKFLRDKGYYNVGWEKARSSWELIKSYLAENPIVEVSSSLDETGCDEDSICSAKKSNKLSEEVFEKLKIALLTSLIEKIYKLLIRGLKKHFISETLITEILKFEILRIPFVGIFFEVIIPLSLVILTLWLFFK